MDRMTRLIALVALTLAACVGGEPRRPGGGEPRRIEPEYAEAREPAGADDRWDVDAALPRSGDPARPNVKVALEVLRVSSERGLGIRWGARGSLSHGVVSLRAALAASAEATRSRSATSTFIIVQAGREGLLALTADARRWCAPLSGLHVVVVRATPEGAVELDLVGRGGGVEAATSVTLMPGQAVVLGGSREERADERRGLGGHEDRTMSDETLVLLAVEVIG